MSLEIIKKLSELHALGEECSIHSEPMKQFDALSWNAFPDILAYIDTVEEFIAEQEYSDFMFPEMEAWIEQLNEIRDRLGLDD